MIDIRSNHDLQSLKVSDWLLRNEYIFEEYFLPFTNKPIQTFCTYLNAPSSFAKVIQSKTNKILTLTALYFSEERFTRSKEALLNDLLVSYKLIKTQLMMMRMMIIMMMIRIYIIDDLQRLSIIYIQQVVYDIDEHLLNSFIIALIDIHYRSVSEAFNQYNLIVVPNYCPKAPK